MDQPWVDDWPMWDEPLGKTTAPFDIERARWRLAKRFNSRMPAIPAAIRESEIDRSWDRHRSPRGRS
jgi:hypothetical protein